VATVGDEPEHRFTDGISIGVLTRIFHCDLVDDVLLETRKVEQRSRLLVRPADAEGRAMGRAGTTGQLLEDIIGDSPRT
jgi:hypothetical protein